MEIVIKRRHMPWPGVRLAAGLRMKIEPDTIAEALCARGFAEKIAEDIIKQEQAATPPIGQEEAKPPDAQSNEQTKKKGK